ncbi:MAG: IS30 family transposase [Prevotella sp.]|nr:IS30 family transposase [Prevotella sp.]MCH3994469.1 IS30 family transposase [Prevotella sp.]
MYKQLTSEQRYTISVLLQKKCSLSFIAETIGVCVSTISREKKRNSNSKGVYEGRLAVLKTRRRKAKMPGNRSISPYVRSRAFELIRKEQWSPEEVAGWLRKEENLSVSKSSIYNWIAAGPPHNRDNIRRHLRHGGRKARHLPSGAKIPIPNRISIDRRPVNANGRTPGDWEMDTIVGKDGKGAIVTLVERKSCFMLMEKLDTGKQAVPLAHTVVRLLKGTKMPVRTITTDNGTEFAAHEIIAKDLNTSVYFAHPYSPWEKGAIENMNGLVRQYIPKKADFKGISRGYIKQIIQKLNNRPRKKNDFSKPVDIIKQLIP